jgi:hypothetical protein
MEVKGHPDEMISSAKRGNELVGAGHVLIGVNARYSSMLRVVVCS